MDDLLGLVEVNNAYSNGGTPLNIQAIATVKSTIQQSETMPLNGFSDAILKRSFRRRRTPRATCAAFYSSRPNR